MGDVALQLASLLLLALLLLQSTNSNSIGISAPAPRGAKLAVALSLLIVAVPLAQLIPLPPTIWELLSGQRSVQAVKDALSGTGVTVGWAPLSVSPHATWLSSLSLLPPLAIFFSTLKANYEDRRALSLVVLAAGVLSAFLGLFQLAQGPQSPLRFYEYTNTTEAVGFFANRNHLAALLYSVLVIAFAWTGYAVAALQQSAPGQRGSRASAVVVAAFVVLVVLVASQVMARSRAGVGLAMVGICAGLLIALSFRTQRPSQLSVPRLLAAAAAVAFVFLTQFGLYRLLERFEADPLSDARIIFARNTLEAAKSFFPLGSGLGSFVRVYGLFEKPQDAIANIYANHAHNDVFETFLETGLAGMVVAALAGLWLAVKVLQSWRRANPRAALIDTALARAGGCIVILLILHSWIDYPLRTAAIMALFAFCCGLLVQPPVSARRNDADDAIGGRADPAAELNTAPSNQPAAAPPISWPKHHQAETHNTPTDDAANRGNTGQTGTQPWGKGIEWPAAWQPKSKPPASKD